MTDEGRISLDCSNISKSSITIHWDENGKEKKIGPCYSKFAAFKKLDTLYKKKILSNNLFETLCMAIIKAASVPFSTHRQALQPEELTISLVTPLTEQVSGIH